MSQSGFILYIFIDACKYLYTVYGSNSLDMDCRRVKKCTFGQQHTPAVIYWRWTNDFIFKCFKNIRNWKYSACNHLKLYCIKTVRISLGQKEGEQNLTSGFLEEIQSRAEESDGTLYWDGVILYLFYIRYYTSPYNTSKIKKITNVVCHEIPNTSCVIKWDVPSVWLK